MANAIEAEGLVKKYGDVVALDGLDLEVAAGTVMGLLGPNGAGKTTTVRILTTLLVPDAGRATVVGHDVVAEARALRRDLIEHVLATSDPTLRAVFAEDVAALIGLILAAAGLAARQLSGSVIPDAVGSILIGVLLVVVAVQLINRNRRFLVGEEADPRLRVAVLRALLDMPEVSKVSYLRLEVVGPRLIAITGAVDLIGDDVESHVAVRLRALEDKISTSPAVAGALFSLSAPDEPPVLP